MKVLRTAYTKEIDVSSH